VNEVEVQTGIDDQEDTLLYPVPDSVDRNPLVANLQPCRDPDTENTDVDNKKHEECCKFEFPGTVSINHKDRDSIDNNLK
jgi:hypothetical protein